MKNLIYITAFFICFGTVQIQAQSTPQPPTPPSTSSSISHSHSVSKSSNSSTKSSISISKNDQEYSLKAKFEKDRMTKLKTLFLSELGEKNLSTSSGNLTWEISSGGQNVYVIQLEKNRLKMNVDRTLASPNLFAKMDELGMLAKSIIGGQNHGDADRLRREADRLKRESERLKREAERLKREADQSSKLEKKAQDLEETSRRLREESMHRGGMSTEIKMLLVDSKTSFDFNNHNASNQWLWPVVQSELIDKLKKLDLISDNADIRLTRDPSGIYVNGEKLISNHESQIVDIFNEHKIMESRDFQYYKKGNHIVVVSGDPDIEGFFKSYAKAGYISDRESKVELTINGYNLFINNEMADNATLLKVNEMMQNHRILPAPGKILYNMGGGKYKLGYSFGLNHIWGR